MKQIKIAYETCLEPIGLLSDFLEPKVLTQLIASSEITGWRYEANEVIHLAEEPCNYCEIVINGILSVEQISEDGEIFSVATFGPKTLIGGNTIFSSNPLYPHTIIALQDSQVVRIGRETLFSLMTAHHTFLKHFLAVISDKSLFINDRFTQVVLHTLRERLMTYLQAEIKVQGTREIHLPVTKTHLAHILGVNRTSVSRELTKMESEGFIKMRNRTIIVNEIS